MKPVNVRLQNCADGTGIEKNPMICWQYADYDAGKEQKACRIYIKQNGNIIYDSGRICSNIQNGWRIPLSLETHKEYQVYVESKDQYGIWERSEVFRFISGVTEKKTWKWISNGTTNPFYVGKEINVTENPDKVYISCAATGQYELKVNGRSPDNSVLNGSWTDFNKRIHYRTYEITDLLQIGKNEISIEVGNGWYHAIRDKKRHFYTMDMGYKQFGNVLAATAVITAYFQGERMQRFVTDGTWYTRQSETVYTNIYGSEDYDARRERKEWKTKAIELLESDVPGGKLVPACYPSIQVKFVYAGKMIKKYEDGSVLYDFGQNMSGLFEVHVEGKEGSKIHILPVEKLDAEGNPWKTVESWCSYTLKGSGTERWKSKFTYGAGRYLYISPEKKGECPAILSVNGYFVTSSARDTGFFYCSDFRYMQIHDLILRAIESNLNHIHTDCPTIERLGWQEANHLMAPSIFYVKEAFCLWEKISQDQRDSQYEEGEEEIDQGAFPHKYEMGLLPSIAPRYASFLKDGGEGSFWDIVPWGSSILIAAYEEYRFTGNKMLLIKNYETAKKYVEYLYRKYQSYPQIYGKEEKLHFLCHGLGDWGIEQNRGESRENIETAYFYRDLKILELTAKWLGKQEEEKRYCNIAEGVLKSYNDELLKWNPQTGEWAYDSYDKTGFTPTQATQAIPIQFGMVPKEKKKSVLKSFFLTCEEGRIRSGEIGLPYILRTLGENGKQDIVQKMLFQPYHPSYYRFVEQGETTLPEFWRDNSRSRNHDMMGAALEWMYRYMAGISSEDGYRHIRISPQLPFGVKKLDCCYDSIMGNIEVHVWKNEEFIEMKVKIPVNTTGVINLSGKEFLVEGGKKYIFKRANKNDL